MASLARLPGLAPVPFQAEIHRVQIGRSEQGSPVAHSHGTIDLNIGKGGVKV